MSDIDTLIGLLESTKKDIITVVNARTTSLEDQITDVKETVKVQNSRIGKTEDKVRILEDTSRERGLICLPKLEELKPLESSVKMMNWISSHKILGVFIMVGMLIIIQSVVFVIFSTVDIFEIFKLIYN